MKAFCTTVLLVAALLFPNRAAAQHSSGWLGVSLDHLMTVHDGRSEFVLVVSGVLANSPASRAGIARGDTVLSLNGTMMNRSNIAPIARGIKPGEKVHLRLRRDGHVRNVVLVAGRRPEGAIVMGPRGRAQILSTDSVRVLTRVYLDSANAGMRTLAGRLHAMSSGDEVGLLRAHTEMETHEGGFTVFTPQPGFNRTFSYAGPESFFFEMGRRAVAGAEFFELNATFEATLGHKDGLLVLRVADRTPAQRAGLKPGDIVVGAEGRRVRLLDDLRRSVAQSRDGVTINIVRNKRKLDLTLAAAN